MISDYPIYIINVHLVTRLLVLSLAQLKFTGTRSNFNLSSLD